MDRHRLLIHSANEIVCVTDGDHVLQGQKMNDIRIFRSKPDDLCALVVDSDGKILKIGFDSELKKTYESSCESVYDASGKSIIPGLVDGHNHTVWAGDRVHEFAMKLAGASYMDIHKAGGGINFTVTHTKNASEDELYDSFKERMSLLLKSGVTLVECKSGYGLDYENELKLLKVINRGLKDPSVISDISVTYCGAHSIPQGSTGADATADIVENHIPKLHGMIKSDQLHIDNIDVFCEKGVFNVDQTRTILEAGKDCGWNINFHAEELSCLNSAEMGAELRAAAMSHLEEISDQAILKMAESGTVATILPTTAYLLHLKHPPVRQMISAGVSVALGTDFNPNAYCLSMPFVMNLACVTLGMTMNEALAAATINAAASVNMAATHGSIEVGKVADLVILDAPRWEHLIYRMGSLEVIERVIKNGRMVYSKNDCRSSSQ